MRKIFLLMLIIFALTVSSVSATEPLVMVTEAWPPYVIDENGKPSGFDFEVVAAVLKKMGKEVTIKFYPWKRCISLMEEKKVDALLDVSKNDSRKKFMHFPNEILSVSSSVLFYKTGQKFKFNQLEDLSGLTVGTSLGYNYSQEFDTSKLFKKDAVGSHEINFKKLVNNRIDLMIINRNVGLHTAKKMGILDQVGYTPKPISGGDLYLAFSKREGHDELAASFSQALKDFKKTTDYKDILGKYGQ